jgi:hypothetical protein
MTKTGHDQIVANTVSTADKNVYQGTLGVSELEIIFFLYNKLPGMIRAIGQRLEHLESLQEAIINPPMIADSTSG